MPDECMLGQARCTEIIKRDKLAAGAPTKGQKMFVITEAGMELLKKALTVTLEDLPEEDQREVTAMEAYHGDRLAASRAVTKARTEYIAAVLAEAKPLDTLDVKEV